MQRVLHTDQIDESQLSYRLYVCQRCGHETPTKGWPLPEPARCFLPVRRLTDPRLWRSRWELCGGELRFDLLRGGVDYTRRSFVVGDNE